MMRFASLYALSLLVLVPIGAASAQTPKPDGKPESKKPAKAAAKKPASNAPSNGATQVATFGDWAAYTSTTGRSKICFAQTEPKSRSPASLRESKAYLFVSFRPADKVKNELAVVLNFKAKDGAAATLTIGSTTYELVTKGENAWVKNPDDEPLAIGTMAKGESMTLQAVSAKGNKTSDRYSLSGFGQALDRAKRDCP